MSGASDGGIAAGPASARCTPGAPMPANSIANKQVGPRSGLYQSCLALSERLWCVPEFGERYLGAATRVAPVAISVSNDALVSNDPVSHLWQCFRLGTPLCALFNHLAPQIPQISVHVEGNLNNANACKALVMRFLIALKERLGWDPDETFTVSQLYLNDTNGFVKVVRSVNKLLDLLEDRGILQERPVMPWSARSDPLLSPSDTRMHVVKELVESERKYVNDLEIMQNYALMLAQHDLVAPDTVHLLFGNLHQLVDIQRRFLIAVEENARRPADEQHFGLLFQSMEEGFSVYEPFCANYAQALAIISAETPALVQAKSLPAAQSCYLDPSYELPTFLIKPVQRICKYPLLLEQLLKNTPQDAPRYAELSDGLQIIRRITDKVNETKRYQENVQAMHDLETRVEDWKGHSLKTFGRLLLNDTFMVSKGDSEREFQVYLFERILLCCKDLSATTIGLPGAVGATRGRARNGSLLRQRQGSVSGNGKKEVRAPLQLKGRIFMNNIVGINGQSRAGGMPELPVGMYALQVWWRGESDVESFSLRCKNDEQLKIWHTALQRLLDAALSRRPSLTQPIPNTSQRSQPAMSLNLSGTQYQWSREAFMQVSTPIVPTPTSELSMSGFLSRNSASHFGEDDLPSTPGTPGSATPFAVPMRSCTDPELLHELGSPHEDQDPLSTFWRRSATQLNGYNSPTVPPLKSFQGSPLSASITGHVSPSTYESIEPDFHNLSQYSIATPRTGFAAGRAAAVQASTTGVANSTDGNMQRTYSAGVAGRTPPQLSSFALSTQWTSAGAVSPHAAPLSPSSSGLPFLAGTSTKALMAHKSSSSLSTFDSVVPGDSLRAGSTSVASSPVTPATRQDSDASMHGARFSAHTGVHAPHLNGTVRNPSTTFTAMLLNIKHDKQHTQMVISESMPCARFYEQVCDQLQYIQRGMDSTHPRTQSLHEQYRIFYTDQDGDRILILNDEDLAIAFDQARIGGTPQLDLTVEG